MTSFAAIIDKLRDCITTAGGIPVDYDRSYAGIVEAISDLEAAIAAGGGGGAAWGGITGSLTNQADLVAALAVKQGYPSPNAFRAWDHMFTTDGIFSWSTSINGTGAGFANSTAIEMTRPGVVQLATGSTNTGRAGIRSGGSAGVVFRLGAIATSLEISARLSAPPDGTDSYQVCLGIGSSNGSLPTDGAYFIGDQSNPNWFCNCANNGSAGTPINSGVAMSASWQDFRIVANAAASQVQFYINNALVATFTTSIPVDRSTGIAAWIQKSVGTGSRLLYIDWINLIVG